MEITASSTSELVATFLSVADKSLQKAAVINPDSSCTTFKMLKSYAAGIQQEIISRDVQILGVYAAPGPELVATVWAALCSGVAYVPLSPTYPEDRIRYMVENSEADLAYILYTSGSTGLPKGVRVTHNALASQLRWVTDELNLDRKGRILHKTPISFDAAGWEILANINGATIVAAEADDYRDPTALIRRINDHAVTHLQVVPTVLQALCEEPEFAKCESLAVIASGGESLPGRLAKETLAHLPKTALYNLYGPTETTINATALRVSNENYSDSVIPLGKAVTGLSLHILDANGEVTEGDTGELAISGVQLADGYHRLPEETDEKFINRTINGKSVRLYRTGDNVRIIDGVTHFRGRSDSQVKIRGHRIELDEIRNTFENHNWVRHAGVFTVEREGTSSPQLTAYVELNPHEAALMDQGVHGAHHQSKSSRVQVRAQIAGLGIRRDYVQKLIPLAVTDHEEKYLHDIAFARKTYRTFNGTATSKDALTKLASLVHNPHELSSRYSPEWNSETVSFLLRSLCQFYSEERLLPKYTYASPGSLYGVQVYAQLNRVRGYEDGLYYLNPQEAALQLVSAGIPTDAQLTLLLVGQRSVISSVYSTNVDEVLHFEAGHLLGALDTIAPVVSHTVGARHMPSMPADVINRLGGDSIVLGAWPLLDGKTHSTDPLSEIGLYIEVFGKSEMLPHIYQYVQDGELTFVSDGPLIRRKDVIAINQRTYDQAEFGVALTSPDAPHHYISLGRALQRLQHNNFNIGLMSSGYSSYTGRPLATARRISGLTGDNRQASYFALGGLVSPEQVRHTGMNEDAVHTQGPTEIITTEVAEMLPQYMLPDVVRIVDSLPKTPNGKIDIKALRDTEIRRGNLLSREPHTPPDSLLEHRLVNIWNTVLKSEISISTATPFFALGGNSLTAVRLIREINERLNVSLPVQAIFELDTVRKQAEFLREQNRASWSRAVPLAGNGPQSVFLFPGLGGYPMNLRSLAELVVTPQCTCYGIQAYGLNADEAPDSAIADIANRDIEQLRNIQPEGPYTLIGYSFGARIAFEVAYQIECQGDTVANLILLAPGSPVLAPEPAPLGAVGQYQDPRFTRVLYSVFGATTHGIVADEVVNRATDRHSFLEAISPHTSLDSALAQRIIRLVEITHTFEYTFDELTCRSLRAPITVIRAYGDDYSFIDKHDRRQQLRTVDLTADHYQILKCPDVEQTAESIRNVLTRPTITQLPKETISMPHVSIKHFPTTLTQPQIDDFVTQLSKLVREAFDVNDSAVSVSIESVHQSDWHSEVYQPEIIQRSEFVVKAPRY